jgi:hypothetical protein
MRSSITLLATIALLTLTGGAVFAQYPGGLEYAATSVSFTPKTMHPGATGTLVVTIRVLPGFHINSVKPNDPDLLATLVTVTPTHGLMFGRATFPKARTISAPSLSQRPLSVYTGLNKIIVGVDVPKNASRGEYKVPVSVFYQGCNSNACFPPKTDDLIATVKVD